MSKIKYSVDYVIRADDEQDEYEELGVFETMKDLFAAIYTHEQFFSSLAIQFADCHGAVAYDTGDYIIYPPEFWAECRNIYDDIIEDMKIGVA